LRSRADGAGQGKEGREEEERAERDEEKKARMGRGREWKEMRKRKGGWEEEKRTWIGRGRGRRNGGSRRKRGWKEDEEVRGDEEEKAGSGEGLLMAPVSLVLPLAKPSDGRQPIGFSTFPSVAPESD
jgi:hypothetical protein